jgi:hypothetical protein
MVRWDYAVCDDERPLLGFPVTTPTAYAPSGIRTRATTLKGWRPRPLVDGGGAARIAVGRVYTDSRGPVAQLVEQGTFNPKVAGSRPARPITKCLQGRGIRFVRRLSERSAGTN